MERRVLKQTIITLIFFLILSGLTAAAYFYFKPVPSCLDRIKNQGEEKIDCGGPCSPCLVDNLQKIKVLWAEAILAQDNFYDLVAKINNPNQNYGSEGIPYSFELYNEQGVVVAKSAGSTYLLPNQTKYLVSPRVASPQTISQVKLSFGDSQWEKLIDYQSPQLVVSQKEYDSGLGRARGLLINKSNFNFAEVDIDILLFDSNNHLLAVGTTVVNTLLVNEERDFAFVWPSKIISQVAIIEMEAETNIFDPDNFISGAY